MRCRCDIAACLLAAIAAGGAAAGELRVVSYNVAGLRSVTCAPGALESVFRALAEDGPAPDVYVFLEVHRDNLAVLGGMLGATAPRGVTYRAATYTNDLEDAAGGAPALFYRIDTLRERPSRHADLATGGGRHSDRWQIQMRRDDRPLAGFYVYGCHLKASAGAANEHARLQGVRTLRADADGLGEGTRIIYAGDLNFEDFREPGYLEFLAPGPGQAFDPLGSGSWAGPANAAKHTQSPRCVFGCGLVSGCLDDRFDFQLVTREMTDPRGIALVPGSYRAFGNDGRHFDQAINSPDNHYYDGDVARSNLVAQALHDASDHLPVIAVYRTPPPRPGDLDGDGVVNVGDMLLLLLHWNERGGVADLDGNGLVDATDLGELSRAWGPRSRAQPR